MTTGERIKSAREYRRISQTELAILSGIAQGTICKWEKGKTVPSTEHTIKLAEAMDVSYEWLLLGKGEMEKTVKEEPTPMAIWYSASDSVNLRNINLIIKILPDSALTVEEKKSVFKTLSDFRAELESKMLFPR